MHPLRKEPDNVGMRQPAQQCGFALQTPDLWRVRRKLWQEDFTGEGVEIRRAPDLVQFGNAAGAEMPDYSKVVPNAGPKFIRKAGRKPAAPPGQCEGGTERLWVWRHYRHDTAGPAFLVCCHRLPRPCRTRISSHAVPGRWWLPTRAYDTIILNRAMTSQPLVCEEPLRSSVWLARLPNRRGRSSVGAAVEDARWRALASAHHPLAYVSGQRV